ncbi:hypothetical protein OIDMADRAFT_51403 [Oidiodendron maius Zn]|uniref:Uncharacterized protein n=1 Tax=Oidiodendron maius (strain Zn) TaxID=913774 RepID=A0A0C3HK23_OIDMZ|nr:hypothetical protein OIDMADRAFT_51403 [Oidiodendron maius Zn]
MIDGGIAVVPGKQEPTIDVDDVKKHCWTTGYVARTFDTKSSPNSFHSMVIPGLLDFSICNRWIDFCKKHHSLQNCGRGSGITAVAELKLIDCSGDDHCFKIVSGSLTQSYAALSYIWGNHKPVIAWEKGHGIFATAEKEACIPFLVLDYDSNASFIHADLLIQAIKLSGETVSLQGSHLNSVLNDLGRDEILPILDITAWVLDASHIKLRSNPKDSLELYGFKASITWSKQSESLVSFIQGLGDSNFVCFVIGYYFDITYCMILESFGVEYERIGTLEIHISAKEEGVHLKGSQRTIRIREGVIASHILNCVPSLSCSVISGIILEVTKRFKAPYE